MSSTASPRVPVADVDILSNDIYAERIPHAEFAELRRERPVSWHDEPGSNAGFWAVTTWHDLVEVHRDPARFSSQVGGTELEELERDPEARAARRTMLETDPPEHTRIRRLVSRGFTRKSMSRWEDTARRLVHQVFDDAMDAPRPVEIDFVARVARQIPILMISRILGVPDDDAEQLFAWADSVVYHADPDYSEVIFDREDTDPYRLLPFRSPTSLKVFEYCQSLARARRARPQTDVMTLLSTCDDLTEQELNTFFLLLVIAGNETARHAINHGVHALATRPDQLELLRSRPDLLGSATEEVLRWSCPQLHFRRTAVVDTVLGGVPITAGDKVVTWYISANYDESQFEDPFSFDLTREPNHHVAFGGGGPHYCLGAWLARLEIRVLLEVLAQRVHHVELTGDPVRVRSNFINGLKKLPVRLTAA
jgi:cytochrome P450